MTTTIATQPHAPTTVYIASNNDCTTARGKVQYWLYRRSDKFSKECSAQHNSITRALPRKLAELLCTDFVRIFKDESGQLCCELIARSK